MKARCAIATDLEFLEDCARRAYQIYVYRMGREPAPMVADFRSHLEQDNVTLFKVNELDVGYAVWKVVGSALFLENIAVLPESQGTGIGRSMLSFLETEARNRKLDELTLYTNQEMVENISFYARQGFQETDRRTENGFQRVYFRKGIL